MNEEEPPTIELNDYYGILNLPKNVPIHLGSFIVS